MRHTHQLSRHSTIERGQVDKAARTVRASLSSEQAVMRAGAREVLRHDAQSVDLTRARDGLPLLFGRAFRKSMIITSVRRRAAPAPATRRD